MEPENSIGSIFSRKRMKIRKDYFQQCCSTTHFGSNGVFLLLNRQARCLLYNRHHLRIKIRTCPPRISSRRMRTSVPHMRISLITVDTTEKRLMNIELAKLRANASSVKTPLQRGRKRTDCSLQLV